MDLVISPNPLLRQVCEDCELSDRSLKRIAKQMARIMYKFQGCGLAGPQVGLLQRLIVIDCDEDNYRKHPITLINPEIVELSGEPVVDGEGCLSLPGITVPIRRQPFARVRYYDLDGNECVIEGEGLLGRCLQHEIDHLNGRTLFETCAPADRLDALRAYELACAAGARPGEVSVPA